MTEANQFDLVVIGGGSGGLAAAQRAAEYGVNVAVIESGRLGGTCVNVGCVPKKIMWNAAAAAHAIHDAAGYGFSVGPVEHDWPALKARRDAYVTRLNGIYANNLANKNIELIEGYGELENQNTVRVGERTLQARHVLIAVGGEPIVPDLPGAQHGITSDGFFELEDVPQRVAMVGSGYISVEFSGMLRALGAQVDLFIRRDNVLRDFDELLQKTAGSALRGDGINMHLHAIPAGVEHSADGLTLITENGDRHSGFDTLIWAVGRRPLTHRLGLEHAGIETDADGFISTDAFQKTSVDNIFAVGDVTGRAALTPVAIAAGRRLADRLYGGMEGRHLDYELIPTVVFTHPPIGHHWVD